ncbi:MAG TPA: hypothetical protein VKU00_24410 [Chthonomonadaceae bacterium]|nr:hypothetical protein [Chthonomonadaceae bacterium]
MSTSVIDLWPEDLRVPDETTPALLMRQQAELLGQRTKGRVEAEVITQALEGGRLAHHFRLKATALGGYVHSLFIAVHNKNHPYPVTVEQVVPRSATQGIDPIFICNSEQELEQVLRDLFASSEIRNAVESLLAA